MDANELTVHDIMMRDEPGFGPGGTIQMKTVVTYYVGPHGQFRDEFPKEQATSDVINRAIDHRVVELRRIVTR